MRIFVYDYRPFDEAAYFKQFSKELGIELGYSTDDPSPENAGLAAGYDGLSILTTMMDEALLRRFYDLGIRMISTRTIGYDHIDLDAARKIGMAVSNVSYSPECVADYTVMLMLMSLRKMRRIMERGMINDFSLNGLLGRELPGQTVGIIGTGRIGCCVARDLSGFGCKILAFDQYEKEEIKRYATYVPLEELLSSADVITLHMPLTNETHHIIDRRALSMMKDQVVLINTARGGLVDTAALIEGIETHKIGAAALDVIEDEFGMYYFDRKSDVLKKRDLYTLRGYPNVLVTHHMAFYSDQAISDMVRNSLTSLLMTYEGKKNPYNVL